MALPRHWNMTGLKLLEPSLTCFWPVPTGYLPSNSQAWNFNIPQTIITKGFASSQPVLVAGCVCLLVYLRLSPHRLDSGPGNILGNGVICWYRHTSHPFSVVLRASTMLKEGKDQKTKSRKFYSE